MTRWRVIKQHPNYEISTTGIVWRCTPGRGTFVGRVKTQCRNSEGYLYTSLDNDREFIHVLMCRTWHGPRPSKRHEAAHRDGNQLNNCLTNVRWVTRRKNIQEKNAHGRQRGELNHQAVLTARKVRTIRGLCRRGAPPRKIAKRYGVTYQNISLVLQRKTWRHVA